MPGRVVFTSIPAKIEERPRRVKVWQSWSNGISYERLKPWLKTQKINRFAAYTSLYASATAIGDTETATLAETIVGEEKIAADKFLRLIPQLAVASVGNTTDV